MRRSPAARRVRQGRLCRNFEKDWPAEAGYRSAASESRMKGAPFLPRGRD
ncbi:MAG: hypothetical protein MPW14_13470 [Candidatus Manganitrophus sp.]|nr:MAG: hypothetical protein MPW14_13470 [Candidatus Manganitrophus sp.]